jgi:hypothetical protein
MNDVIDMQPIRDAITALEVLVDGLPEDLSPYHGAAVGTLDVSCERLESIIRKMEARSRTPYEAAARDFPDRIPSC